MSVNNMSYSAQGMELTESFEGLELTAYQDIVGVWTIGYGHTGQEVHPGMTITQPQAANLLQQDIAGAGTSVNQLVTVPLTQNQFDALVDFTFNLGAKSLATSTLLRLLNGGDYQGAAQQFPVWCHAGGVEVPGLLRRRQAEQALFLGTAASAAAGGD